VSYRCPSHLIAQLAAPPASAKNGAAAQLVGAAAGKSAQSDGAAVGAGTPQHPGYAGVLWFVMACVVCGVIAAKLAVCLDSDTQEKSRESRVRARVMIEQATNWEGLTFPPARLIFRVDSSDSVPFSWLIDSVRQASPTTHTFKKNNVRFTIPDGVNCVVFLYRSSSLEASWLGGEVGFGGTRSGVDSDVDQRVGRGRGFHGG